MKRLLTALVLVLLAACTAPVSDPQATSAPAAKGPPASVSGSGISKTKPFRLAGNYSVTWTAQSSSSVGCYHGASLARADGTFVSEMLANEMIKDKAKHTGGTQLYNMDDASYYVDASSGCSWTFTFTPQ